MKVVPSTVGRFNFTESRGKIYEKNEEILQKIG